MKKIIALLIFAAVTFDARALNWLLYPTTNAPGPSDTFMIGTLTTNWQLSASDLANWNYTNVVARGHVSSASNAVPNSPLFLQLVAFTNAIATLSNYVVVISNLTTLATNSGTTLLRKTDSRYLAAVTNNNATLASQLINGNVVVSSNFTANGVTSLVSNTAPRSAFSNFLVSGGTWTAPAYRGRLKVTVQLTNTIEFLLTNLNTTENHFAGRELGTGTNRVELSVDTNPNDQIFGTNWVTSGSNPGAKIISSFWSEDE